MSWQSNFAALGITSAAVAVGTVGLSQYADYQNKYLPDDALPDVETFEDAGLVAQVSDAISESDIDQAVVYNYDGQYKVAPGVRTVTQSEQDANTNVGDSTGLAKVKVNGLGTVEFDNGEKADNSLMSEIDNMKFSPNTILSEYENAYPTGTVWTNNFYYENQNKDVYRGGYGCAGFAYMLSDGIYGDAHTIITDDVYQIVPYCIVELYGNQHTAFVLSVNEEAGEICVVEANVNGTIIWGSYYSFTDVSAVLIRQAN